MLDFVDKDIAAFLALMDLVQQGTHEIVASVSEAELSWIARRARLLVAELIRCSEDVTS